VAGVDKGSEGRDGGGRGTEEDESHPRRLTGGGRSRRG
jgi:hypothetical protein